MTSEARSRAARRRVDGMLLLDKPVGISSNAALQRAKRLYAAQKAGHTGTLDPLASGLLPICFGEATKFAQSMLDARKSYVATVRFGASTSTGDAEGDTIASAPVAFGRDDLEAALARFVGTIAQVPPRHAALKWKGRPYYDYARAGVDVPRAARKVHIGALEIEAWSAPDAVLRVECGKGTYVRALAEDIAAALGTVAHLAALRRTAVGPFRIEHAYSLERLGATALPARDACLLPTDAALADLPLLSVDADQAAQLLRGRAVDGCAALPGRYRCHAATGFVGVVEVGANGTRPLRMVQSP